MLLRLVCAIPDLNTATLKKAFLWIVESADCAHVFYTTERWRTKSFFLLEQNSCLQHTLN